MTNTLIILGCSKRKSTAPDPIEAVDRYDGPSFQVLRKCIRENPDLNFKTLILSGKFGLLPGHQLIPYYDHRSKRIDHPRIREDIENTWRLELSTSKAQRIFVSVGQNYWPLIEPLVKKDSQDRDIFIATGGSGGRASLLAHWLRPDVHPTTKKTLRNGEATLLGTTVRLTRSEVLNRTEVAAASAQRASHQFETWYVRLGSDRIAPKWLVSVLFDKPVSKFRTSDARRVLLALGVECKHVCSD